MESARTDAVATLLIFLHLLKRDANACCESLLAHPKHLPFGPDPSANSDIDNCGRSDIFYDQSRIAT